MNFSISGFKCFNQETSFDLSKLTLLTGANSGGKSSVIQALLLTKKVSDLQGQEISFNDAEYALDLGTYDDVVYRSQEGDVDMVFNIDEKWWKIKAEDIDVNTDSELVRFEKSFENLKEIFSEGFSFLTADREPPHYVYKYSKEKTDFCNCHGSNVGDVLNKHGLDNIESKRSYYGKESKLKLLLDEWVKCIFPGTELMVESSATQSAEMYKIVEHGKNAATNIGFGITYALPIIINGLLMKENGWLIVENPEAHLHPKAQSYMGYFLACMAAAGVRVVAETHSEHIVNGARRFALQQDSQLKPEDISIYFFKNNSGDRDIKKIDVESDGNLSDLPIDFFDQVRQDMREIIQLGSQRC